MLSIISIAFNQRQYTEMLLASLAQPGCADAEFELIFINNGSTDKTGELVRKYPLDRNPYFKRLNYQEFPENRGVAAAINQGVRLSSQSVILQADNDVVFGPNSLTTLLAWNRKYPESLISPNWPWIQKKTRTRFFKDATEVCGSKLKRLGHLGLKAPLEVFRATGSCWLCSRELFLQVGGWDEGFRNICASDDFIWKISLTGALRLLVPSPVYHAGEVTRKQLPRSNEQEQADSNRFQRRWGGLPGEKKRLSYWQQQAGLYPDPN